MFNSSKDVGKTLVISPRKSSGICINVPERVAQNAQGLTGNGKGEKEKASALCIWQKKKIHRFTQWKVENHKENEGQ